MKNNQAGRAVGRSPSAAVGTPRAKAHTFESLESRRMLSDGSVTLATNHVSTVKLVTIASNAKLDLTDNKLVLGVRALVDSGRNSGTWDGTGIVTSALANTSMSLTTLAVASAAEVGRTTFAGQSVLPTDTLVMYTYSGDANLDGKVNADDYFQIDSNYKPGSNFSWFNGDYNYDGFVNADDYTLIDYSQHSVLVEPTHFFGTAKDDRIVITSGISGLKVTVNGTSYNTRAKQLRIEGNRGNDDIQIAINPQDADVQIIIHGGAGNDTIVGGAEADRIFGGDGNDIIVSGDGKDTVYGEVGDDSIRGGGSNDLIDGGDGADTLRGDAGNDNISGGANSDRLRGSLGNDTLDGGGGRDLLAGEDGDDSLNGAAGDDVCDGGAGDDFLSGGSGNNLCFGHTGHDRGDDIGEWHDPLDVIDG